MITGLYTVGSLTAHDLQPQWQHRDSIHPLDADTEIWLQYFYDAITLQLAH